LTFNLSTSFSSLHLRHLRIDSLPLFLSVASPPFGIPDPMDARGELMTPRLERALRWAAVCHRGQSRKGGDIPYIEHVMGVALILDRLGFDEDVVIAGLLHDAVEDTGATLAEVRAQFGDPVGGIVAACSEIKTDADGRKRPWIDRKRDHLATLDRASVPARGVILADKLHNLLSIALDLRDGRPVWSLFNAGRADVLWYYRTTLERIGTGDPKLEQLASRCRHVLAEIEAVDEPHQDRENC
jgi:(p)ppGpp synthase/HD superfamily hydrolase